MVHCIIYGHRYLSKSFFNRFCSVEKCELTSHSLYYDSLILRFKKEDFQK